MREFTENVYRSNFCFDGDARDSNGGGTGVRMVQRGRMRGRKRRTVAKPIERPDVITAGNWTNGKCILLLCRAFPKRPSVKTVSSFLLYVQPPFC